MRVAVVSPETIHHRDADDTRRLQHLLRGLADRGHDVTVCCARWWDADAARSVGGEMGAVDAAADGDDASANDAAGPEPPDTAASTGGSVPRGPRAANPDDLPPAGEPAADPTADGDLEGPPAATGADVDADARDDGDVPRTIQVDGITYRAVVPSPDDVRGFATRVPLSIRRAHPDVVHAVATPPAAVLGARAGATLARAPVLAEWYDPSRADPDAWTTRQALSRPARVVTPSRLTRRQLLELGAEDGSLRVVPNAVDVEQIRSVDPVDGPDVVYARRLDEHANLESLLLGLAELRDREWQATIVGDGPARRQYEQQVRDLRIDDRVTFAGGLDREARLAVYRGAHVFAQTARRCVFATELLWALACGCVGIVEYHAASSAHELVEGRERGFRTTNPQETAQAIRDAGDLDHRTVDDSFERFDRDAVLEQYVGLYEELIDARGVL